jgi:hypothetical protein
MARSRRIVTPWRGPLILLTTGRFPDLRTRKGLGRACLLLGAGGTTTGGLTILGIGLTDVFVPEDLDFMRLTIDTFTTSVRGLCRSSPTTGSPSAPPSSSSA